MFDEIVFLLSVTRLIIGEIFRAFAEIYGTSVPITTKRTNARSFMEIEMCSLQLGPPRSFAWRFRSAVRTVPDGVASLEVLEGQAGHGLHGRSLATREGSSDRPMKVRTAPSQSTEDTTWVVNASLRAAGLMTISDSPSDDVAPAQQHSGRDGEPDQVSGHDERGVGATDGVCDAGIAPALLFRCARPRRGECSGVGARPSLVQTIDHGDGRGGPGANHLFQDQQPHQADADGQGRAS